MGYLDYPGLQRYHGKVQDEINELKDDLEHIPQGLSNDAKIALLACFSHVAWDNVDGQTYYDALEAALYEEPEPTYNHSLVYRASSGVVLSEFSGMEVAGGGSAAPLVESISNNILNVKLPQSQNNDYVMIRMSGYNPAEVTKARVKGKVRFNALPFTGNNFNYNTGGLILTIKAGQKDAGIYTNNKDGSTNCFAVRTSTNDVNNIITAPITLNQWYELEADIEDNVQTVKVDGQVIYTGDGNTQFASSGAVFTKSNLHTGYLDMDIDWLSFEWNTDTPEWGTDYTWLYRADSGEKLSQRTDIVNATDINVSESLADNLLHFYNTGTSAVNTRYNLVDTTSTNAKLEAKVRFNSMSYYPESSAAYGFRLQLSNGTNGILFYEQYNGTDLKLVTFAGNTLTAVKTLSFDTWYKISVESNNGTYTIKVNDEVVYTSTTASTYYCTANRIQIQTSGYSPVPSGINNNLDVDVAWITYKDND